MSKRMRGLAATGLLLSLLTACSTAPLSESRNQEMNITPCIMEDKDSVLLFNTVELGISPKEKEEDTTSTPVLTEDAPAEATQPPEEYIIEDFPVILQFPELPTGCEIAAMTMALHYYGYDVDKTTMAAEYLPTVSANRYYGEDGRLYGSDLRKYFVGNPFTQAGYICGTEAILTASNTYLQDVGSSMQAVDKSGVSPEELYKLVSQDTPVVVWVTIGMANRNTPQGWYTEDGTYVDWSTNDHGAVLIGYSEDTVTIADPISGMVECSRTQFESVFASRSYQCVILES